MEAKKSYKVLKLELLFSSSLIAKSDPFISVEALLSVKLSTKIKSEGKENLKETPKGTQHGRHTAKCQNAFECSIMELH